jgi:hypothetical protein
MILEDVFQNIIRVYLCAASQYKTNIIEGGTIPTSLFAFYRRLACPSVVNHIF